MENIEPRNQEWQAFIAEFKHTSDRAVVILGSTYLQTHLGRIIHCFLVDHQESLANLLNAGKPLGSFFTRINAAFALGLISKIEYHDLNLILEIRDVFLNELDSTKFNDDDIRRRCYKLKTPREVIRPEETPTARRLFVFAIAMLAGQLTLRARQAERERRTPPESFMLIDVER